MQVLAARQWRTWGGPGHVVKIKFTLENGTMLKIVISIEIGIIQLQIGINMIRVLEIIMVTFFP